MESPLRPPASPGTPLYVMSPERANRQALPQSPSLPSLLRDDPFLTSPTRSSDVANKVLQFNNMTKDKAKNSDAALRRAVVGREEAEHETRRLREEHSILKKQIEAGKARELKVAQRLESVMEEMQRLQETGEHRHAVYEKEVRRARKEAFKSSSALVQMQEELKTTRNRSTLMREAVEEQKRMVNAREKEIFEGQCLQSCLQEEVDELKRRIKLTEEERDVLRTSLREEEVARIAAEGRIPLPPATPDAEFSSPKKKRARTTPTPKVRHVSNKENEDPVNWYVYPEWMGGEMQTLRDEVRGLERAHKCALETIDFMQVECQLKRCSCRLAEAKGEDYIYKPNLMQIIEQGARELGVPPHSNMPEQKGEQLTSVGISETCGTEVMEIATTGEENNVKIDIESQGGPKSPSRSGVDAFAEQPISEELIEFEPQTGTFRRISGMAQPQTDSPSTQASPSHSERPAAPANLTSPLDPAKIYESPSLLSLADHESRPSDQLPRNSDECMVLTRSTPTTPCTEKGSVSITSDTTPYQERSFPSPIEFPPTPGADLTLTAPLNFQIPTQFARLNAPGTHGPGGPPSQALSGDEDSFVTNLPAEVPQTPTTPRGHPSLASPLCVPKTADARMVAGSKSFDIAPSSPNHSASTRTRVIEHKTTVTVPLAEPASSPQKFPYSPGASKTREEALASIQRWRQGRSRSVTAMVGGTPRRVISGVEMRRDISAPTPIRSKSRAT